MMNKRYQIIKCDHYFNHETMKTSGITCQFLGRTDDLNEALSLLTTQVYSYHLKDMNHNTWVFPEHIRQDFYDPERDCEGVTFYYVQDLLVIDNMACNINFPKGLKSSFRSLGIPVVENPDEFRF